jgi:hypothetical protein
MRDKHNMEINDTSSSNGSNRTKPGSMEYKRIDGIGSILKGL